MLEQSRNERARCCTRATGWLTVLASAAALGGAVGWCGRTAGAQGTALTQTAYGLRMTFDGSWGDGFGYRPMRITVAPVVPSPVDRTLQVEFLVSRRARDDVSDLRVVQDIEVPAGSGPMEATLSVPWFSSWGTLHKINVSEDGQLLEKLSTGWVSFTNPGLEIRELFPVILTVGDAMPDTGRLVGPFPLDVYTQGAQYAQYAPYVQPWRLQQPNPGQTPIGLPTAVACSATQLSARWIDYSSLDAVCISLDELARLEQNAPATLDAILRWTSAGGNLWVYGVGWDWKRLAELERLVKMPPSGGAAKGQTEKPPPPWQKPGGLSNRSPYETKLSAGILAGGRSNSSPTVEEAMLSQSDPPNFVSDAEKAANPNRQGQFGSPANPHFVLGAYDLGMIVALAPDEPFPGTVAEWRAVLNATGVDRLLWHSREGVSMARPNPDYWDFLIPGVGLAPVTEFLVLISIFVLAVGPVNYWLLRRWKRLYLLVVTIPASAAVVTLALFVYAVLADGLGTRARARSVTLLDQGRGQAVCRARVSYYSGLAPRGGLRFPEDVTVLPLQEFPTEPYRGQALQRELLWEGDQWLRSGWLSSRTPTQYLTARSRPTASGLERVDSPDGDGLKLKNRLGTRILQLAVRSGENDYYWAEGVDPEATVTLQPISRDELGGRLARTWQANVPRRPLYMDPRRGGGLFGVSYRRSYYYQWGQDQLGMPSQQAGRMERTLRAAGESSGPSWLAEPGRYVAVVEQSPEVVLGTPSARQEASFHVILGKW